MCPESLHILIVDANPVNARALPRLLRHHGHDATTAHDSYNALFKAACLAPDVVLIDLEMPGVDGVEVVYRLSLTQRRKPPFIIAMSGCRGEDDLMMAFAS